MYFLITKIYKNFINSINGLKFSLKEHSFVVELFLGLPLLGLLVFYPGKPFIKLTIVATYFLWLVTELINTTIEKVCDRITQEYDIQIKNIKDIASAAVFLVVILLIIEIVWLLVAG